MDESERAARYRVILVSLPPGGERQIRDVMKRPRPIQPDDLPLVVRITDDDRAARETAWRLRYVGAGVVVAEEREQGAPFCARHSAGLVFSACAECGEAICPRCALEADGEHLCRRHYQIAETRSQWVRSRQLLALFAFAVFLYYVADALQRSRIQEDARIDVALMQFVPPGQRYHPLVRALNSRPLEGRAESASWVGMKEWFDAEYQRYTGGDREILRLHRFGPWSEDLAPPPLATPDDGPLLLTWRSLIYARYWRRLARSRGVSLGDWTVKLFVVFTDEAGDSASHSRGSERGRIAISKIALSEWNPAYGVITVAHELAHTLGATDKYEPDHFRAMYPQGYVEPFVRPLYPQRYAELMAVDVPMGRTLEREARSLSEVRVGYQTAAEVGWIAESEARFFYQHQQLPEVLLTDGP